MLLRRRQRQFSTINNLMQRMNGCIVVGRTSFELRLHANGEERRVIGSNGKITPPPILLSDRYLLVLLDHQRRSFESIPIHEYIVAKIVYKVGLDLELRTVSIGASQTP